MPFAPSPPSSFPSRHQVRSVNARYQCAGLDVVVCALGSGKGEIPKGQTFSPSVNHVEGNVGGERGSDIISGHPRACN